MNSQHNLKVCFMGGEQVGVIGVLTILSRGDEIMSAVSYSENLTEVLNLFGIPVCKSINNNEFIQKLRESDILLSVHGKEIVKADLLKLPKYGGINLHPYFYKYKGANPVERALRDKSFKAIVGAHIMGNKIDEGKLLVEEFVDVSGINSVVGIYNKLYSYYCTALLKALNVICKEGVVKI